MSKDIVYMIGLFLNLLDTQTEKEKFMELYNEYKDLLYWIALKRTNCIEDAEECVQETFFYVAKHFDKITEIVSKQTKIYLSTIVTGFAIDIYNNSIKLILFKLTMQKTQTILNILKVMEKLNC